MNVVDVTQAMSPVPSPRQAVGQVGKRSAAGGAVAATEQSESQADRTSPSAVLGLGGKDGERGSQTGASANEVTLARQVDEARRLADIVNNRSLSFELNREVDRVVISVIDTDAGRVIKKIPPEEMLRVLRRLHNTRGLILDAEG